MYYQTYFVSPEAGVASLLPCYWSYAECFKRMNLFIIPQQLIKPSLTNMLVLLFNRAMQIIDNLAEQADAETKKQMQTAFNLSSDYELMYWEMCYNHEQWPHQRFNSL